MNKYHDFIEAVNKLKSQGLLREYTEIASNKKGFPYVTINDKTCLVFSTCNYLGYSEHPLIKSAVMQSVEQFGVGSGGSRYIGGTNPLHHEVEKNIAQFHHKESAILYNSGFVANTGTIASLAGPNDIIFSDEKNHASIIDGVRLTKAKKVIWKHNDMNDLEEKLKENNCNGNRLIIAESLYSMDGDFAPLQEITQLCESYRCLSYLDEIHAIGVYGDNGSGYANQIKLAEKIDFIMGGAAKGLGSLGGYVCLPQAVETLLKSTSRSFIFTISLPPMMLTAIQQAIGLCEQDHAARQKIKDNSDYLRAKLNDYGYNFLNSTSHLFPIMIGDSYQTKKAVHAFIDKDIYVQGVQFPTVPEGEGRLRVSMTAAHNQSQIDYFIETINQLRNNKTVIFQEQSQ